MMSVTSRVKQIRQPRGGFIPPSQMTSITLEDNIKLYKDENIHSSLIGLVVDYMTRFLMGSSKEEAFNISFLGAKNKATIRGEFILEEFNNYLNGIEGLDDTSIINACKIVTFDVWYRNAMAAFEAKGPKEINPDMDTIENIRIMITRSLKFWELYGPIKVDGFNFAPNGYTSIVSSGDGDFLTNDTLWDFKVSWYKPTNTQTLQLLMYFIMGKHSNNTIFDNITKIGIFNPRLNCVYLLEISEVEQEIVKTVERDVIGYETNDSSGPNGLIDYFVDENLEHELECELDYGRWIMQAKNGDFADLICKSVISKKLVNRASHTPSMIKPTKCYFYLCESDMDAHEALINYLKENHFLPRARDGAYKNMFFKVASLEEYKFYEGYLRAPLNLKQIMDLQNGEWTKYFSVARKYLTTLKAINTKTSNYLGYHRVSNKNAIGNLTLHDGDVFNGALAKAELKKIGKTPQDLAEILEVSVGSVRNWLNGKSRPYAWYAFAVCVYLNLDENELITKA